MYFYLHRNSKKWTFYSVKILKCESFLSALRRNSKKGPVNFYLNLSKAFDSLNHNILLNKLSYYGVTHMANTLLRSYLSNRKQYVMVGDVSSSTQPITSGVPQGSVIGPFLFNVLINDIIKSSDKFNFILYADDTTLNSTLDVFGDTVNEIQLAIMMDLQKISKWLDLNKLCLNITKSKFMLFHMPQRITPQLHLNIKGSPIENVNEFNFLGLTLDCNLNFKPHTKIIAAKISRVIGVLHKLKYIFPAYLLRMIYNSLILPHLNYSLLAWGIQCPNIELLQKKAVRVVNFKSPVAHTEPILKGMNQLKLPDMYTCQLLKLYYKLYRIKLPAYFENFLPEYGDSQHNLRNNCIGLPAIRCEFGKLNAKYQMHFRLRELANPSNPPLYPNINPLLHKVSKKWSNISIFCIRCCIGVTFGCTLFYKKIGEGVGVFQNVHYNGHHGSQMLKY